MFNFLSLNLLIFSPVIAAIIVASPLFGKNPIYIRRFSKTFATIHFLYSLLFIGFYNSSAGNFYDEIRIFGKGWLSKLGISAAFGVDGFTILLVVLTSFIFLLALIVSKTMIRTKHKMYYTLMLLLLSTVLGIFCAKDMFVFLLFWEAELIPMYFLIAEWGSEKCKKSAMKYVLYTFFGSIFIFLAMIALYYYGFQSNGVLSSSIDFLRVSPIENGYSSLIQNIIFLSFLVGFAVKLPIIPLHSWLPNAHSDAPTPISMILSAILLKTGAYGLIRYNFDLFPDLFIKYSPYIMVFAVVNIFWAAFAAFKQKDIKRVIAYSSISHMGLFLLGFASLTKIGFDGAIFIIFAHAFIVAGLFLIVGLIQQQLKTRSLQEISGLGKYMPKLMIASYIVSFAAIGIPLTVGFPGEISVFIGAFSADFSNQILPKICALFAISSLVLSSSYILKLFHCIFCQTNNNQKTYHDITGHRLTVIFILCFCILFFGCFPDLLMQLYNEVTDTLIGFLRI